MFVKRKMFFIINNTNGDIIIYQTDDGLTKIDVKIQNETVWLSQQQMAVLYDTTKQNISSHIKNIFDEEELIEYSTVKEFLTVQKEGNRNLKERLNITTWIFIYILKKFKTNIIKYDILCLKLIVESGIMNLEKIDKNNTSIIKYSKTDNVLKDICSIINSARDYAFQSVNIALVERNWLIGYRIAEEELKGEGRADYGTEIIKKLSKELKEEYGKGFDARNLYYFLNFYKTFPNILNTLCSKSNGLLSWSHYRTLLQVFDKEAREWYENEALGQTWSVRTLQRNISSQYYYRLLKSQIKEPVIDEMKKINKNQYLMNKLEFVKNPVIAEFLGYSLDDKFTETELESSIINNLQKFLMELRKRICFCGKATTYSY